MHDHEKIWRTFRRKDTLGRSGRTITVKMFTPFGTMLMDWTIENDEFENQILVWKGKQEISQEMEQAEVKP